MCNQSSITLINDENSNYFSNEFCNYAARTGKAMKLQHMWWKRDKIIMGYVPTVILNSWQWGCEWRGVIHLKIEMIVKMAFYANGDF